MNKTPNYGLEQPPANEYLDPGPFNRNMDIVDAELKKLEGGIDSVNGAPILDEAPADNDYAAITDTSDEGNTKRVPWSRIKTALGALFAPASHGHTAEDISAGDFPAGVFSLIGSGDSTLLKLRRAGFPSTPYHGKLEYRYPYTILTAADSETDSVSLKLRNVSSGPSLAALVRSRSGVEDEVFYLYGEHNKPVLSGGYTGDGTVGRKISLGGIPRILFVANRSSMGTISEMAIVINFENCANMDGGGSGVTFLNANGNPMLTNNQISISAARLIVGNSSNLASFFNQPGVSYSYWGVRI